MKFDKVTAKKVFEAVKIAKNIRKGCYRRATWNDEPSNFKGYRDSNDRMFVIGDCLFDIPSPDSNFNGDPAVEVTNTTTVENLIDGTYIKDTLAFQDTDKNIAEYIKRLGKS